MGWYVLSSFLPYPSLLSLENSRVRPSLPFFFFFSFAQVPEISTDPTWTPSGRRCPMEPLDRKPSSFVTIGRCPDSRRETRSLSLFLSFPSILSIYLTLLFFLSFSRYMALDFSAYLLSLCLSVFLLPSFLSSYVSFFPFCCLGFSRVTEVGRSINRFFWCVSRSRNVDREGM